MIAGGRVEARTKDLARAVRFYVETLGMKLVAETKESVEIDAGEGFVLALDTRSTATMTIGLHAKSGLADIIAVLENRGIAFALDQSTQRAHFVDPDGNRLYLYA